MNTEEQIAIMKFEARLANRAEAEGLRNWNEEARAASLAVRRARGSVWGWDKRKRAIASTGVTPGFDAVMEQIAEDAPKIKREMEIYRSGGTMIGPRDKYADEVAAQRLEAFKAWLAEVKRVEGAIDDFNGLVAAMGGLTGGMAKAQKGQRIGSVATDVAAEAAAKKAAVEKSIRRNYEKRNADYLRENPEDRGTMLDMVAEKAEYYSAQPAQKVEIEKNAYRRIRDTGAAQMRETPPTQGADYRTLLEAKRNFVREREAVRPQLQPDEVAYPSGNGIWIGRLPNGDERVISAFPEPNLLPKKAPAVNDDLMDAIEEARLGARIGSGLIVNRHTSACASSKGRKCDCSCGGSQHGTQSAAASGGGTESGTAKAAAGGSQTGGDDPEASDQWEWLLSGFRELIAKGEKPTLRELKAQLAKDGDKKKYRLAAAALAEAWHTHSLDKFQDSYGRDPKNNFEFRTFQKKSGVPPEFVGGK